MEGELGAGKTTLVRGLVEALPGGQDAEVASPSFNLVNLYPTQPETAHVDLYRCEGAPLDDSCWKCLQKTTGYFSLNGANFSTTRFNLKMPSA